MGNTASCFYGQKLEKYKSMYPTTSKLQQQDPRLKDPQYLRQQIKKLDFIILHQNCDLATLQAQNDKLRKQPRNKDKVLNNSKKIYLLSKNGMICKFCLQKHDNNKIPVEQLVKIENLCGTCKGNGLLLKNQRVKSQQCGVCNSFYQYLWKFNMCNTCNGVGILQYMERSPYGNDQAQKSPYGNDQPQINQMTHQQLAKKY